MKHTTFVIVIIIIITAILSFLGLSIIEDKLLGGKINKETNVVDIKIFTKTDCSKCTKLNDYLEVYKKAGVKFGNISIKKYGGLEYKTHFNKYNIKKLPFIIFSKELNNYETISNSWDDTFGYKSENGEYIPTDIIPPYFDLKTKKIEGLIDVIYIGDNSCSNCYSEDNVLDILSNFGLKFKNIRKIDSNLKESTDFIDKYNIDTLPTVILSDNTKLYKNFAYFWQTIGTIEKDGSYILRQPGKLGLNTNN